MSIRPITAETTPDLAFISQHLFTAVLWVDESLDIKWLNTQTEQLLAISRGRLLNHSILTLLAPAETNDGTDLDVIKQSIDKPQSGETATHKTYSLTERFAHAHQYQQPFIDHDHRISPQLLEGNSSSHSGAILLVDYSVTPVSYELQTYFIIEMWSKDRHSRISKEQRQQQQYAVARHMLRSVAHEVKNPLAGIRGAAQLLQRQFAKVNDLSSVDSLVTAIAANDTEPNIKTINQKLLIYTDIIISETDRLTQLISQLLGSNQLPNWQALNIHQTLEHVLTLVLSQYPTVKLQRDYDLSIPDLVADKDQLIQVFLNLINNACESMLEHQQVLVNSANTIHSSAATINNSSVDNLPKPTSQPTTYQAKLAIQTRIAFQHTIGSQQHKQVLQVTITDNGSGIDSALIGQIFFPMVTSRAAGTGLGLAIVQDIVSRHHGMIDVISQQMPDSSETSFILYLPFTQPITS
ncbi:nitrogen regulation protein NR(II) [Psychrobacter sp. BF1]|uniref:two-component system sensor histidine kinase NtrB n=1 Tax=Psychrobacter sp. BF1 TaxID=2821147 RepID=UPI001C4E2D69|nr:ATP-binding protein [Psychrobacter sp. BF1]